MRRIRAGALLCLALAVACTKAPTDTSAAALDEERRDVTYSLRVRGAVDLDVQRDQMTLLFRELLDPRVDITFFGIENVEWMPVEQGEVVAGLAILGYTGDGVYTMKTIDPTVASGDLSNAWLDLRADAMSPPTQFRSQKCSVTIEQEGAAGRLDCARLKDAEGKKVSLELEWAPAAA